jgi:hypothetical protein
VGLGLTFAKDQIQQTFVPVGLAIFSNNNNNNYNSSTGGYSKSLTDILKGSTYGSSGIFLAASLKLYVSGAAPKGVFFQVGTTYAVNNLVFNPNYNNYNGYQFVGSPNIAVKNLNFNFTWGYQFIFGVGKVRFVNTAYAGIGIKKITYTDVVDYNSYYNSNTGTTTNAYTGVDGSQKTVIMPSLIIGFSIGVGW